MGYIWSVVGYTDNLKGFRRRCMIKKLDILMRQIEDGIEHCYDEAMFAESTPDLRADIENAEFCKVKIEELENQYSIIWRIRIQLSKGTRTSKTDLDYVNKVHKEIALGIY